ncbi:MAG: hypothetical protein RTU92_09580 [Candidatus Thorarchaeota archaeon]
MLVYLFVAAVIVFAVGIILSPKMKGRGSFYPRDAKMAEARTSMVFAEDDTTRAVEYEHRFSASRTGMIMGRSGYRVRRRR